MERENNFWVFGLARLPFGSSGSMRAPFCLTREADCWFFLLWTVVMLFGSIARNRSLSPLCLVLDCTYGWQCSHEWQCPNSTFLLFHLYKHGIDFRHQSYKVCPICHGDGREWWSLFHLHHSRDCITLFHLLSFNVLSFNVLVLVKNIVWTKKVFPSVTSDGDWTSRTRPSVETFLMMCP